MFELQSAMKIKWYSKFQRTYFFLLTKIQFDENTYFIWLKQIHWKTHSFVADHNATRKKENLFTIQTFVTFTITVLTCVMNSMGLVKIHPIFTSPELYTSYFHRNAKVFWSCLILSWVNEHKVVPKITHPANPYCTSDLLISGSICKSTIWGSSFSIKITVWKHRLKSFHSIRFSFHDGVIDELCPDAGDPNWVLNVKRGILSSFQNTMKRFDIDSKSWETDVSGSCDVNYVVQGASPTSKTSLLVKKTKDISSCIHRYKTNSILQTTPYDFRKQYSVWPILQSSSHCDVRYFVSQHDLHTYKTFETKTKRFSIDF